MLWQPHLKNCQDVGSGQGGNRRSDVTFRHARHANCRANVPACRLREEDIPSPAGEANGKHNSAHEKDTVDRGREGLLEDNAARQTSDENMVVLLLLKPLLKRRE